MNIDVQLMLIKCSFEVASCVKWYNTESSNSNNKHKHYSIGFYYSRHRDIPKMDCDLCRNMVNLKLLRANRLHKIEISGTKLNAYEVSNGYTNNGNNDQSLRLIYTIHDACPVELRPWNNGYF